jgi:quercetin dioxygenase-like cupin family protein
MSKPNPSILTVCVLIGAFLGAGPAPAEETVQPSVQPPAQERALVRNWQDPTLAWGPCPEFFPAGCKIAVVHGDPAKDNADVFFKVPGDYRIPAHWHTSAERMVLVSGRLHVTYDGQDEVVLAPGNYAYGPARLPHHAYCEKGEPCVLFIGFESPVDAIPIKPAVE